MSRFGPSYRWPSGINTGWYGGFSPKVIKSCVGEFRPQVAVGDGRLSTWSNSVVGGMGDLTAVGAARPTVVDGWVVFDGSANVMALAANYPLGNNNTLALRLKGVRTSGVYVIVGDGIGGLLTQSGLYTNSAQLVYLANFAGSPNTNTTVWYFPDDREFLLVVVRNGTNVKFYVNGARIGEITVPDGAVWSMQALGAYVDGSFPTSMQCKSATFFNEALSDSDRRRVEKWMGPDAVSPETSGLALWIDRLNLDRLWTTSSRTTPVVNADPVGYIDRAGGDIDAQQSVAGQRPSFSAIGLACTTGQWLDLTAPITFADEFTAYTYADIGIPAVPGEGIAPAVQVASVYSAISWYANDNIVVSTDDLQIIIVPLPASLGTGRKALRLRRTATGDVYAKYNGTPETLVGNIVGPITVDGCFGRADGFAMPAGSHILANLLYTVDCTADGFAKTEEWGSFEFGVLP